MKNYVQTGDILTLTAPSGGVVSGQGYMIGGLFVVALATVAQGLPFAALTEGVVELAKDTGFTHAEGAQVFWDNTAKAVQPTGTGHFPIGVAVAATLSGDTLVKVKLESGFKVAVS